MKDYIYITNEALARSAGMSLSDVKRAKKELIEAGLIKPTTVHLIESGAGTPQVKLSKQHYSGYKIQRGGD